MTFENYQDFSILFLKEFFSNFIARFIYLKKKLQNIILVALVNILKQKCYQTACNIQKIEYVDFEDIDLLSES
jgi:hypothetical protein